MSGTTKFFCRSKLKAETAACSSFPQTLAEHNILSAPLIDTTNFDYLGFVSALDVVHLIIRSTHNPALRRSISFAAHLRRRLAALRRESKNGEMAPTGGRAMAR